MQADSARSGSLARSTVIGSTCRQETEKFDGSLGPAVHPGCYLHSRSRPEEPHSVGRETIASFESVGCNTSGDR